MSEYVGEYVVSLTAKTFTDLRFHRHEEVVRCRDCAYYGRDDTGEHCTLLEFGTVGMADKFCAWGERRGDAE